MKYSVTILSLLFFIGALISLLGGIYIIKLNPKRNINRGFLALSISLFIWSFGFGMSNSCKNAELALLWRRFSAVGWTSFLSITLHFLMLLTNSNKSNKWGKYLYLLHIPAIINMYIFAFSGNMAIIQYNLVRIDQGWTNIAVNNIWDYFYYSYYFIYTVLTLSVIWKWKNIVKEKIKIRQANGIFASMILAIVFASFTDLFANTLLSKPIPQIGPLFILIPIRAMYYSVKNYDLINQAIPKIEELIITDEEKQRVFRIIAIGVGMSGLASLVLEYYLFVKNIESNLVLGYKESILLTLIGIILYFLQSLKNKDMREKISIFILVLSIPIITLSFLSYSSVTIWSFPMIILISSLVFSKKTLLVSTGITSIITQIIIWISRPSQAVVIDGNDFVFRIIILSIAVIAAYQVNLSYVSKIKLSDFQMKLQKMNARLSSDFISVNKENIDRKINNMLVEMGLLFKPDRIYLYSINHEKGTITCTHQWYGDGIINKSANTSDISLENFDWWINELKNNKIISIGDTRDMKKEAKHEQKELIRQDVRSVTCVAIEGTDKMEAFLRIDSLEAYRKWPEHDLSLLEIISSVLSDALLKVKAEEEINTIAYYDHLTKLPNRFWFIKEVTKAIDIAEKTGKNIGVMLVDLDNFRLVNESMGHECGDYLIRKVGKTLNQLAQEDIVVARSNGDKFMIMLNNITDNNEVLKLANKVMDLFSESFTVNNREVLITASAGISIYPTDGKDPEILAKHAFTAMDKAKNEGKNKYLVCTDTMKQEILINAQLSKDMDQALERGEFVVFYQPQVDLATKEINGLEALIRWKHPEKGMISPGIFIPLAESNGMINSIGEWVLETSCMQSKKWQDMGFRKIPISVNLSAVQLVDSNITNNIEDILKKTGLDPKYLELEVTESVAIKKRTEVEEVLNRLKKLGVGIAIDDFGTEYSSFSRLKELPIDRIKIDMQFTQGIENNEKDRAIVKVIINLAKKLNMNVIAEGAETKEQVDFLYESLCDDVQGYYYYKPMPIQEIEKILINRDISIDL